jgi:hypothetical protein
VCNAIRVRERRGGAVVIPSAASSPARCAFRLVHLAVALQQKVAARQMSISGITYLKQHTGDFKDLKPDAHRQEAGRGKRVDKALEQDVHRRLPEICARVSASRKIQIMLASGTVSFSRVRRQPRHMG